MSHITTLATSQVALGRLLNRINFHSFRKMLEALPLSRRRPRLNPPHRFPPVTVASATQVQSLTFGPSPLIALVNVPANQFASLLQRYPILEIFLIRSCPRISCSIDPATTLYAHNCIPMTTLNTQHYHVRDTLCRILQNIGIPVKVEVQTRSRPTHEDFSMDISGLTGALQNSPIADLRNQVMFIDVFIIDPLAAPTVTVSLLPRAKAKRVLTTRAHTTRHSTHTTLFLYSSQSKLLVLLVHQHPPSF